MGVQERVVERKSSYFNPKEWEDQETLELEPYYQQLREMFSQSIPKYFGGDRPIGVSLTGGLDSRMIMAWLRTAPGSIPCYSSAECFMIVWTSRWRARWPDFGGQHHQVIPVGNEFLARFGHYSNERFFLPMDASMSVILPICI